MNHISCQQVVLFGQVFTALGALSTCHRSSFSQHVCELRKRPEACHPRPSRTFTPANVILRWTAVGVRVSTSHTHLSTCVTLVMKFSEWCAWGTWIQTIRCSWCQSVQGWFCCKMHWPFQTKYEIFKLFSGLKSLSQCVLLSESMSEHMGQFSTLKQFFPPQWNLRSHNQLFSNFVTTHQCCINLLSSLFGNRLSVTVFFYFYNGSLNWGCQINMLF